MTIYLKRSKEFLYLFYLKWTDTLEVKQVWKKKHHIIVLPFRIKCIHVYSRFRFPQKVIRKNRVGRPGSLFMYMQDWKILFIVKKNKNNSKKLKKMKKKIIGRSIYLALWCIHIIYKKCCQSRNIWVVGGYTIFAILGKRWDPKISNILGPFCTDWKKKHHSHSHFSASIKNRCLGVNKHILRIRISLPF